jgi:predicted amidophosphoribosyltransferase
MRVTGAAAICYPCASASITVPADPCPVCSQALGSGGRCRNRLCSAPDRSIDHIAAVAVKDAGITQAVLWLKHDGLTGWARIFGRLIVGHLEANRQPGDIDLIVANPTYLGPGSAAVVAHTERVIDAAADEDPLGTWPWDTAMPRALIKAGPTPPSGGAGATYPAKRAAADALLDQVAIPDPSRIAGRRILVYDDICTTGLQLDRVARVLKHTGGATTVEALVLARAPWQ